jgi:hypothetical protein
VWNSVLAWLTVFKKSIGFFRQNRADRQASINILISPLFDPFVKRYPAFMEMAG